MPRTRLDKQKNERLSLLLHGHIYNDSGNLTEGAEKLRMSLSTLSRRMAQPGTFTIDELLNFGRKYHIPIEDLRAALHY